MSELITPPWLTTSTRPPGKRPTVTGALKVGSTLKAATKASPTATTLKYQWYASGAAISGATKSSLLLASAQAGKTITVKVSGSKTSYTSATATSKATLKVVKTAVPTISGTAKVGATLTAKPGTWTTGVKLGYQWYANGAAISGATASTFVVTSTQAGKAVTVAVSSAQSGYAVVTEKSTASVKPARTAVPTITGTPKVGVSLTAVPGIWTTGTALGYQWFADGAAISGATKSALALTTAHAGKALTVKVTGTLTGYTTLTETSKTTSKVTTAAVPTITGTAKVSATLTANPGTWTTGVKFAYQWYADGTAISGATASTFVVTSTQAAKTITVGVAGTLSGYATVTEKSTTSVKPARTAVPTITGTPKVGASLTAVPGTWTTGTKLTYQWYADGEPISGAVSSSLLLGEAQDGKALTVKVTGTQSGYATFTETSKATLKAVTAGLPIIVGDAKVGSRLIVAPGAWTSGVTSFTYQWYSNGSAIQDATTDEFELTAAEAGQALTVKITSAQTGYASVAVTSTATAIIAVTSAPVIGGDPIVGDTLVVDPGEWTPSMMLSYRWFADGVEIPQTSPHTLFLTEGLLDMSISVEVTGTLDGFTTFSELSEPTEPVRTRPE